MFGTSRLIKQRLSRSVKSTRRALVNLEFLHSSFPRQHLKVETRTSEWEFVPTKRILFLKRTALSKQIHQLEERLPRPLMHHRIE